MLQMMKRLVAVGFILVFLSSCSDDDAVTPDVSCRLRGTITAFGNGTVYDGGIYVLYIDVDSDPANANEIKSFTGTFPGAELSYNVDISDVTPGTYYLHMTMDSGQGTYHVGYYGGDPDPWDVPASVNADISCGAVLDFVIGD